MIYVITYGLVLHAYLQSYRTGLEVSKILKSKF